MNKFLRAFAYGLLAFATTTSCIAAPGESPPKSETLLAASVDLRPVPWKPDGAPEFPPFALGLSEEQMEKWMDLHDKYAAITTPKQVQLKHLRRIAGLLCSNDSLDKDKIRRTAAEITKLETELSAAREDMMLDHAELLTPEQRKQTRSLIVKRMMCMPPLMIPPPPAAFGPCAKHPMPFPTTIGAERPPRGPVGQHPLPPL
ncbi:MAG: Spy/CpxP family protein refolding chaperone [Candidatus Obscuribacterales bacterium]|nr:Spy/CpxP family protein refolding chaperone [Candidatus Obscuribacterales bacterium]